MKTVSQEEQKEIQLFILQYFIDICEKHNISYYAGDGTLLGTVRHHGYIPWDDDIDIYMFRDEYDRFISIYLENYNDTKIKLINRDINKNYHLNFAKLYDSKTVLQERNVVDKYSKLYGVYIDIFPLDYVPRDVKKRKQFLRKNYYYFKLSFIKIYQLNVPHNNRMAGILYNFIYYVLKLIPMHFLTGLDEKRIRKCNTDNKNSGFLKEVCYGDAKFDCVLFEDDFRSYEMGDFEALKIRIPIGYDRILRTLYGEYMKYPPKSQQINHGLEVYYVGE